MGVLAGRFPGKAKKGFLAEGRKRLVKAVNGFIAFAEGFGLAVNEREVYFRKNAPGGKILIGLENYGVASCNMGTDFWKHGR